MPNPHAVIIGGSSGIGLATAGQLIEAGYRVTIAGRSEARLAAAGAALGGKAATLVMDAAAFDTLPGLFGRIGALDHLVLALGSAKGGGPFAAVDIAQVRAGFEEKFFPHFACAQAALPYLAATGSITFVTAVSADAAAPGTAGLGAANAAIAALVPILAMELGPRRVNAVSPGVIDTPWWDFLDAEQKQAVFADYGAKAPVGRVGRPQDIAHAIRFVTDNSFMTGHTIICDGGLRFAN
jgi:NAD(P)-dependent dehydrogenase (short-subunit alcohol dehydrogenase family)